MAAATVASPRIRREERIPPGAVAQCLLTADPRAEFVTGTGAVRTRAVPGCRHLRLTLMYGRTSRRLTRGHRTALEPNWGDLLQRFSTGRPASDSDWGRTAAASQATPSERSMHSSRR